MFGHVAIWKLDVARSGWDLAEIFVSEAISWMEKSHGNDCNQNHSTFVSAGLPIMAVMVSRLTLYPKQ